MKAEDLQQVAVNMVEQELSAYYVDLRDKDGKLVSTMTLDAQFIGDKVRQDAVKDLKVKGFIR